LAEDDDREGFASLGGVRSKGQMERRQELLSKRRYQAMPESMNLEDRRAESENFFDPRALQMMWQGLAGGGPQPQPSPDFGPFVNPTSLPATAGHNDLSYLQLQNAMKGLGFVGNQSPLLIRPNPTYPGGTGGFGGQP